MKKEIYLVEGMSCASCKKIIETIVGRVEGVESVVIDFDQKKMNINYEETKLSNQDISDAVKDAGDYVITLEDYKKGCCQDGKTQENKKSCCK